MFIVVVVHCVRCVLYLCRTAFQRLPLNQNIDKHPVSELTQTSGLLPLLFTLLYNPSSCHLYYFLPFALSFLPRRMRMWCLSKQATYKRGIYKATVCFFLLPTRYVNKVYFPFPQIVCVYVFYFIPCEIFHKYHMSATNMPPMPRGCLFVFVVSRWLHIF